MISPRFISFLMSLGVLVVFAAIQNLEFRIAKRNVEYILRKESLTNDSYNLAKGIIDLEQVGLIHCTILADGENAKRLFLDNSQGKKCNFLQVTGLFIKTEQLIFSNSGNTYKISYRIKISTTSLLTIIAVVLLLITLGVAFERNNLAKMKAAKERQQFFEFQFRSLNSQVSAARKVAHDIKSPISTLNLIATHISNEEIKEIYKKVVSQIAKISDQILADNNLGRISSGLLELQPASTTLWKVLTQIKNEYILKKTYYDRDINFSYPEESNEIEISQIESLVLYRALNNFIQNSVEATADNTGKITVSLDLISATHWTISIKDNGKGIPSDLLRRLGNEIITHDEFQESKVRHGSGNGIGLFYIKQDLETLNLNLVINSTVGLGTEIFVKKAKSD